MKSLLRKLKRKVIPVRGLGFPGDGRQRQRTAQIDAMQKLGLNKFFVDHYPELLRCNESDFGVADKLDVAKDLSGYFQKLTNWMNYPTQIPDLKGWVDPKGHQWPNLHPAHQHIVDAYKTYRPGSVCEVGAGAGVVAKYVYAASEQSVKLACVEGSEPHLAAMRLNFSGQSDLILPNIKVPADIVKAAAQKLPFPDGDFEMIYTCTLMMHIPFVAAVAAAAEFARVSSKYILHVEGYHTDGIVKGFSRPYNYMLLDYSKLYETLGFKTVKKFFYRDPYATEYDYIVFLAEKDNHSTAKI